MPNEMKNKPTFMANLLFDSKLLFYSHPCRQSMLSFYFAVGEERITRRRRPNIFWREKDDIARSPLNLVWFAYVHGGLLRSCGIESKTTSKDKQRPQNRIGNFVPAFRTILKVRAVATEKCDLLWIFKTPLEGFLQTKNYKENRCIGKC